MTIGQGFSAEPITRDRSEHREEKLIFHSLMWTFGVLAIGCLAAIIAGLGEALITLWGEDRRAPRRGRRAIY